MRTYNIQNQKPLFRFKHIEESRHSAKREIVQSLEAACDAHEGTDSLILLQLQLALKKAREL
jgi:hypothetical protein